MKKGIQILLVLFTLMLTSCYSDNDGNNTTPTTNPSGFVWRENLIDAPLNTISNTQFTVAFNTLIANHANNVTLFN